MTSGRAGPAQAGSREKPETMKQLEPSKEPRKPIDAARLRRLTTSQPLQKEGAVALIRMMRDRY